MVTVMKEVKEYCIAWSHPALRALLRFLWCPKYSPLNINSWEVWASSFIANEVPVSVAGMLVAYERILTCRDKAFEESRFESPPFPCREMIQIVPWFSIISYIWWTIVLSIELLPGVFLIFSEAQKVPFS